MTVQSAGGEAAYPFVSIIIPFLNEERYLPRCLDSILAQSYPPERMEILAVDGGSRDASRQVLAEYVRRDARIRILDNPRRYAAAGLNVGLRQARGEIILRVDAHCIIGQDYVARCVETLREHAEIGDVGGPLRPIGETTVGRAIALALSSPFSMGGSPFRYAKSPRTVDTVYLGAYRRRDLDAIGPFNESLHANEDYELNYRLRSAGFVIWCDPRIESFTFTRRTLSGLAWQYLRYGFWKARVALMHPRSIASRHGLAFAFTLALLITVFLAIRGWWLPLGILGGGYIAANFFFSYRRGWPRAGAPALLLPLIFVIMQGCWSTGILAGLLPALWSRLSKRYNVREAPPHA